MAKDQHPLDVPRVALARSSAIELYPQPSSDELYVFFGGIAAGLAIPPFEFCSAANILDASRLFIRDIAQCWYQCGIPGAGRSFVEIGDFIRGVQGSVGASRLTLVGNSMGGFAALLFGAFIRDCHVVAFAPQTFISPTLRLIHRDRRWAAPVMRTYWRSAFREHVWCLSALYKCYSTPRSATIIASSSDRLDRLHAMRMQGFRGITVSLFEGGGHQIVRQLRDKGMLGEVLKNGFL